MSTTYKAIGINLKGVPMGENDRLLTILTREHGLIRAVAPGARKHQSSLRGRSGLFVINQLLIVRGKSLDKVIQAEGVESFPGLSQDLRRLTAGQYLAELVLFEAQSHQPQDELFTLLNHCLRQLDQLPAAAVLPCLTQATFQLLELAGIAPQVHTCCLTQEVLTPDFTVPNCQASFHLALGGTVSLTALERLTRPKKLDPSIDSPISSPRFTDFTENRKEVDADRNAAIAAQAIPKLAEATAPYSVPKKSKRAADLGRSLTALELSILQQLSQPEPLPWEDWVLPASLSPTPQPIPDQVWLTIERLLRAYTQYHFERPIQSATLIETCFSAIP